MPGVNGDFFSMVLSMTDVAALESLREQLIREAYDAKLNWDSRMMIYQKVQMIIERLIQLQ
jgi:hypothetical protein